MATEILTAAQLVVENEDLNVLLTRTLALLQSALRVIDAVTLAPPHTSILQGRGLGEVEGAAIREALVISRGSQKEAALLLDISARQLHYKLRVVSPDAYIDLLPYVRPTPATEARRRTARAKDAARKRGGTW